MKKEQIIIDGVNVRICDSFIDYYMVDETRFQDVPEDTIEQDKLPVVYKGLPDALLRKNLCNAYLCHCKDKANCYYKQLARKTQELYLAKNEIKQLEQECTRYRKALEEIEEYIKEECNCVCTDCLEQGDCHFQDILDIINKAKGEE